MTGQPNDEVLASIRQLQQLGQLYEVRLLLLAGAKVPRTGGVLIARGGQTKDELAATLAEDPFLALGLADYAITEFVAGKYPPVLAGLV